MIPIFTVLYSMLSYFIYSFVRLQVNVKDHLRFQG